MNAHWDDLKDEVHSKLYHEGKLVSKRCTQKYLQKVGLWDLVSNYSDFDPKHFSISEIVKSIVAGIQFAPRCKTCGNYTRQNNDGPIASIVFREYCSVKCSAKSANFASRFEKVDRQAANEKRQATLKQKYGVEYNSQRPEVRKILSDRMQGQIPEHAKASLTSYDYLRREYVGKCRTASDIANELGVYYGTVIDHLRQHGFEIRQHTNYSVEENDVAQFVESLVPIVRHYRGFGAELDIWCPQHKLAIEYNGLFWHSSTSKGNEKRHLTKTQMCEDNGLQLLHIFSDEWLDTTKQKIWKSIIRNKLGLTERKLNARNCSVIDVGSSEMRSFMETNHLHGFVGGTHIGLIADGELVMALTYGKSRFDAGNEILRIATKIGCQVRGGVSKLVSKLPEGVYTTYGDRRFSTKNSYTPDFMFVGITSPNYWWTDGNVRISRYRSQKYKLSKLLVDFDPELSEFDNMTNNRYRIIYDSGNCKFHLQRKTPGG